MIMKEFFCKNPKVLSLGLLLFLLVVPMFMGVFWIHILTEIVILGLFSMSFNLLFGYTGKLSFGHAAYYGAGAYVMALLLTQSSLPFFVCVVLAVAFSGVIALVFGFLCVRSTGIYFSILTLALGQFVYYIVVNWYDVTGGDNGIQGIHPPEILQDPYAYYYMALGVVSIALLFMSRVINSPFGYTLRSIRDNSHRAEYIGIDVKLSVLMCFVLAGMLAGLAGALWAPFARSIAPDLANWTQSGVPVFMTILGGPGQFLGPMVGAGVYTFLQAFVTAYTPYWPLVIGTIMIAIVLFLPGGITGGLLRLAGRAATGNKAFVKAERVLQAAGGRDE
jgi:branched-chain amino acid transport system permease protein